MQSFNIVGAVYPFSTQQPHHFVACLVSAIQSVMGVRNCQVSLTLINTFEQHLLWSIFEQLVPNNDIN